MYDDGLNHELRDSGYYVVSVFPDKPVVMFAGYTTRRDTAVSLMNEANRTIDPRYGCMSVAIDMSSVGEHRGYTPNGALRYAVEEAERIIDPLTFDLAELNDDEAGETCEHGLAWAEHDLHVGTGVASWTCEGCRDANDTCFVRLYHDVRDFDSEIIEGRGADANRVLDEAQERDQAILREHEAAAEVSAQDIEKFMQELSNFLQDK